MDDGTTGRRAGHEATDTTMPTDNDSIDDAAEREQIRKAQFAARNDALQTIITACAEHGNMDEWGAKSEVAREVGVDSQRVSYVMNNWEELVDWRRARMADPDDEAALRDAYGDDYIAADGAGGLTVTLELPASKAFTAQKLLPSDIGRDIFFQMTSQIDMPVSDLRRIFSDDD